MTTAQQLVAVAREAGFRESGVTATKARTIAGIRCSLRLEVCMYCVYFIVSTLYLRTLVTSLLVAWLTHSIVGVCFWCSLLCLQSLPWLLVVCLL